VRIQNQPVSPTANVLKSQAEAAYPPYAPQPDLYGNAYRYVPRPANFGARMIALLLDGVILGVIEAVAIGVLAGFARLAGYLTGREEGAALFGIDAYWLVLPAAALIALVYYIKSEPDIRQKNPRDSSGDHARPDHFSRTVYWEATLQEHPVRPAPGDWILDGALHG
jgi:hypothetical protein